MEVLNETHHIVVLNLYYPRTSEAPRNIHIEMIYSLAMIASVQHLFSHRTPRIPQENHHLSQRSRNRDAV